MTLDELIEELSRQREIYGGQTEVRTGSYRKPRQTKVRDDHGFRYIEITE